MAIQCCVLVRTTCDSAPSTTTNAADFTAHKDGLSIRMFRISRSNTKLDTRKQKSPISPNSFPSQLNQMSCYFTLASFPRLFIALTLIYSHQPFCTAQETPPQESQGVTLESVLDKYRQVGEKKWESKIQKLEERSVSQSESPADALLFFGSSSIRRWETINADMVPYPSINFGYGGAKYVDMVLFADRIFKLHQYRALILFAANDVKVLKDEDLKDGNSSPEEVRCCVEEIIRISKSQHPDAPIFIIEVTPTESRFAVWDQSRKINATLREIALTTANTWHIATAEHYLNADGTPKAEYFVDDKVHLNEKGYQKWAGLIKQRLDTFLPPLPNR